MNSHKERISITFHWNATVWILIALVAIPFIALSFLTEAYSAVGWMKYLLAAIFLVVILIVVGVMPIRLEADKEGVRLRRVLGSLTIPASAIVECKRIDNSYFHGSTKAFSIGKIKRSWDGRWYTMYATEFRNLVLVRTKKMDYIFSCTKADELVEFVNGLK